MRLRPSADESHRRTCRCRFLPGQTPYLTENYLLAGPPPAGVRLPYPGACRPTISDVNDYPFGFNGQLQTDVGYGSGVAVQTNVVLTAAHMVFNDQTLSYVSQAYWYRSGSEVLTYAELDRRANRFARFLVSEGVTTDTPVGLYFKRSLGFVIAALAVLKAGGAYVPLDSSNPIDRILFMVRDSQIPIVLTGSRANLQLASSSDSFRVHLIEDPAIQRRRRRRLLCGDLAERPCLHHLHFRLYRSAQGR